MKVDIILVIVFCLSAVQAADQGDWVKPSDLPVFFAISPFYAGYLNITATKAYFYVYTYSQSNPGKDPVVIMLSPGPGCSSLHSWLYSKGQFVFVRNTSSFRHSVLNWNAEANVLYIQGPAGVGFSYGDDAIISDDSTQSDYFKAILKFYQKFPELKDQEMYLTGMQYAGITAPRLALNIIDHNRDPQTPAWQKLKLSGLFLFNPCTYGDECDRHFQFNKYTMQALKNHYYINEDTYEEFKSHCTMRTSECVNIEKRIQSSFKQTGADLRNLYKECLNQIGDYGCVDHLGIDIFLNTKTVKIDLHAESRIIWELCNATLQQQYVRDDEGSLKIYETLLRQEHNLRIWIVSGTQSGFVPTLGTKKWVDQIKMNLGLPTVRLWEPWFYHVINAGEIETMLGGLTFLTIRSAGYYMFEDQPEIANYVYTSFLKGQRL